MKLQQGERGQLCKFISKHHRPSYSDGSLEETFRRARDRVALLFYTAIKNSIKAGYGKLFILVYDMVEVQLGFGTVLSEDLA